MNKPRVCDCLEDNIGSKIELHFFNPDTRKAQELTGTVTGITEDDPCKVVINDGKTEWQIPAAYVSKVDLLEPKVPEIVIQPAPEPDEDEDEPETPEALYDSEND